MKKIWILNHYATNMFFDKGGRHFCLAKYLMKNECEPIIFCASTLHNSSENLISDKKSHRMDSSDQIKFVFIKASDYLGNGIARIKNMLSFFIRLFTVTKKIAKEYGVPDIIIASSVHPLTCVAGIFIAKRYKIPCIVEIRDLWPESFVSYGLIKRKGALLKLLYEGEKWLYKKADKLIFTMEGGRQYIVERGWDYAHSGPVDLNKVYHINNGVDLDVFNYNKEHYKLEDEALSDKSLFKVVYTGSIRHVNNLEILVNAAKEVQSRGYEKIKILVYGDGDERMRLEEYAADSGITNIVFKGRVDKKYIPYILYNCDLNISHLYQDDLFRFGVSLNKLFDYFASGKPILSVECGYDIIKKYQCGIVLNVLNANEVAKAIINIYEMDDRQRSLISENVLKAVKDYDYKILAKKLMELF